MKINGKKGLRLLAAGYLLYILFYFNISYFLPESEEMRMWASAAAFLIAIGGGVALILGLLWRLRIQLWWRAEKKVYADILIGMYAFTLLVSTWIFANRYIDALPHETVDGNGKLIISVWESKDSMRMYYCEPTNAFLRHPLSDDELRAAYGIEE